MHSRSQKRDDPHVPPYPEKLPRTRLRVFEKAPDIGVACSACCNNSCIDFASTVCFCGGRSGLLDRLRVTYPLFRRALCHSKQSHAQIQTSDIGPIFVWSFCIAPSTAKVLSARIQFFAWTEPSGFLAATVVRVGRTALPEADVTAGADVMGSQSCKARVVELGDPRGGLWAFAASSKSFFVFFFF